MGVKKKKTGEEKDLYRVILSKGDLFEKEQLDGNRKNALHRERTGSAEGCRLKKAKGAQSET